MQDTLSKPTVDVLKGGEFLIKDPAGPEIIFIPDELNQEQQMIRGTVKDFLQK